MSQSVILEQGPIAYLRLPLPEADKAVPLLAAESLRPDIGVTMVLVPLTFILCSAWGIRPNLDLRPFALVNTTVVLVAIIPTFFLFMVVSLLGLRGDAPGLTRQSTAGFLRNGAVLTIMSWVYSHLKAGVLLGTTYDVLLRDTDRWMLGGADAWALCREVVPLSLAPTLSTVYLTFFPLILGCIFWLTLMGRTQLADALTCSIVLGYYLGVFAYHILPAYGPAYLEAAARPDAIAPLIVFMQQLILDCTQSVQQDPGSAVIVPWRYIAAFPSLHMGHVLVLTWYMRYSRLALMLLLVYSFLTAVATLYFGWHYLTDLVGGTAVALLVLWLTSPARSGFIVSRSGRESGLIPRPAEV